MKVSKKKLHCHFLEKSQPLNSTLVLQKFLLESDRMTNVLGITPISMKQSLIDMAYSMIEAGKIKKTSGYRGPPGK